MKYRLLRPLLVFALLFLGASTVLRAEERSAPPAATDPSYRLSIGDLVGLTLFGEPELALSQKLDSQGRIRLALVGDIAMAGRTVREAERLVEQLYIERRILRQPMCSISVQAYTVLDIAILGAVRNPGKMTFPPEKSTLDITDVVTRAGGFLPTAKSDAVKVTRVDPNGRETTVELNVEAMLTRRGATANTPKEFLIHPGDRIWVPERLF